MEEVNSAALLSARLHSSWNVHASLICAVALRVCSDKMWQKKKKNLKIEKRKKNVEDKRFYCGVATAGWRNCDVLAEAFRRHFSPS